MPVVLSPQDRRLANFYAEFPMQHCVPLYFGNPTDDDSKINNGTASLLKRGRKLFAVTNHHVTSAYFERVRKDEGVRLQVGGLNVNEASDRIVFDEAQMDVVVLDFSDRQETEFHMFGNVSTKFYELGDLRSPVNPRPAVAFGGFPGAFRVRVAVNEVRFHTLSSGASKVIDRNERRLIISVDHDESVITSLTPVAPPADLGGMSGGPVFQMSKEGRFDIFSFSGIIAECGADLKVMRAIPVELFAAAFL